MVVRVVLEEGESKIMSIKEALDMAHQMDLDLVEISPNANPPVCKVIDYQKFLYSLKKKQKDIKSKTAKVSIKEIRLGPNTDDHDFNFKVKHAIGFLEDGNKVTIMYKEQGEDMLMRFAKACEEVGKPDQMPKLEGKRMILILSPKK